MTRNPTMDELKRRKASTEVQLVVSFTPCFPWHCFIPWYSQPQQAEKLTKLALLNRPRFREYKDPFFLFISTFFEEVLLC